MAGVRQFDEQEVIALALDVFWRKGLHDATMQDLAAVTGVQRGSLYNAYGDKEAIFLRVFDQYAEQFLETAGIALAHGSAGTRLQKFLDVIVVNMTSGSPPRGCLTTRTALDAAISSTAVRERVLGLLGELGRRQVDGRGLLELDEQVGTGSERDPGRGADLGGDVEQGRGHGRALLVQGVAVVALVDLALVPAGTVCRGELLLLLDELLNDHLGHFLDIAQRLFTCVPPRRGASEEAPYICISRVGFIRGRSSWSSCSSWTRVARGSVIRPEPWALSLEPRADHRSAFNHS